MSASDLHESMKDPVIRGQYLSAIRNRGKDVLIADVTEAMDLLIEMAVKVQSAESRLHEVSVACATAEIERDELRKTLAATQDGAAEAINHSLQLQSEIERRDAEAGEPVAWISERNLANLGRQFSVTVKHEPVMVRPVPLYTAAPPNVLPPGWKLVPIEPTEDMVISGFESKPREGFSDPDDWGAFEAMSGCQQAAHKARLCYAAMIAAAPTPE